VLRLTPGTEQIVFKGWLVMTWTRRTSSVSSYLRLRRMEDLHLHGRPAQRTLQFADPALGVTELLRGHYVAIGLDRDFGAVLEGPLPFPHHRGAHVQLAHQLGLRDLIECSPE
jgi:hypothetical protein